MKAVTIVAYLLTVISGAVSLKLSTVHPQNKAFVLYANEHPLPDVFEACDILNLENVGLNKLDAKQFAKLRGLSELHVTKNQLGALEGNEFESLPELQVLVLKFNAISEIPKNELSSLQKLLQLYLDENNISVIDKDLFPSSLEVISLSANDIAKLHYKTFSRLLNLRKLDISFNALTSLHGGLFSGNDKLEELNMHGNRLMHIGPQIFDKLSSLVVADFEKNPCVQSWIKANNIAKLNETIHEACEVTGEVQMEWLRETVEHLEGENKELIKQCNAAPVTPVKVIENQSTNFIAASDFAEMQQEMKALREENEKLKAPKELRTSAENKNDNLTCEAELENLQLEMNVMEEKFAELEKNQSTTEKVPDTT